MAYKWTCAFCKQPTTITNYDEVDDSIHCTIDSAMGKVGLRVHYISCPNTDCQQLSLMVTLHNLKQGYNYSLGDKLMHWNLIPSSTAKVYSPEIVPPAIIEDYEEACKIKDLSPKSSAALARRALQGMIRHFWKVKRPEGHKGPWRLVEEIKAIQDLVEPDVWSAIDAVRDIGNIGAHMEQDVNIIIEVEPEEAERLIGLIEMLIEEWYINQHKRKMRLEAIKQIAVDKKAQKNGEAKVEESAEVDVTKK